MANEEIAGRSLILLQCMEVNLNSEVHKSTLSTTSFQIILL